MKFKQVLFNQTSNFHVQSQNTKSTNKANLQHEFTEMFLGRQPGQDVKVLQISGTDSVPIFRVLLMALKNQNL